MTPQELFDILKEYGNYDEETVIGITVELLNSIRNNPTKFTNELDNIIEQYAKDDNRCCCCGSKLSYDTYKQKSEYQGIPTVENIRESYCPSCGYMD